MSTAQPQNPVAAYDGPNSPTPHLSTSPADKLDDAAKATVVSQWSPHPGQRVIMNDESRFRVVVCGRRWGKTVMAAHLAFEYAWENPGSKVWWVAPTFTDANDLGFDTVDPLVRGDLALKDPKRTAPREHYLANGSVISYRSGERVDSLRGHGLDFLVIDEAGSVPDRAWSAELRPALADTQGRMLAIGTPRGRNWFFNWFVRGQSPDAEHAEVASWQAPTYMNPHVADSEVDAARVDMPDVQWRQEFLAEFTGDESAVFPTVRRRNFVDYALDAATGRPPYVHGWDFGRQQNYTVGCTLDATGTLVNFERIRRVSWNRIARAIRETHAKYPGEHRLDASRDNKIVTDLENEGIPIEAVRFTASTKRDMVDNLAARLESGELMLSTEAAALLTELEAYELSLTPSGNVRYSAPENHHDDAVDALALAAKPRESSGTVGVWGSA